MKLTDDNGKLGCEILRTFNMLGCLKHKIVHKHTRTHTHSLSHTHAQTHTYTHTYTHIGTAAVGRWGGWLHAPKVTIKVEGQEEEEEGGDADGLDGEEEGGRRKGGFRQGVLDRKGVLEVRHSLVRRRQKLLCVCGHVNVIRLVVCITVGCWIGRGYWKCAVWPGVLQAEVVVCGHVNVLRLVVCISVGCWIGRGCWKCVNLH